MNRLFGIILFFVVVSCSDNNEEFQSKIQGDWVVHYPINEYRELKFVFSFEDSLCRFLHPSNFLSKFNLFQDTLVIHNSRKTKNTKYKFLINALNDSIISLSPITNETKLVLQRYNKINFDTLNLNRIEIKNDFEFDKIGFFSSVCFGVCPSMYLEIDYERNILFQKLNTDKPNSFFSGKISEKQFSLIKTKINSLELKKLDEYYSVDWTCDQSCEIVIQGGTNIINTGAYGYGKEPIELRLLFEKLMDFHDKFDLTEDSTVISKFFFSELYNRNVKTIASLDNTSNEKSFIEDFSADSIYFVVVEEMPKPIGGIATIKSKIIYPKLAKEASVRGRVYVYAYINENGIVDKTELVSGIGVGCDEEAMRVIKASLFKPGKQRGKKVKVKLMIPILFEY